MNNIEELKEEIQIRMNTMNKSELNRFINEVVDIFSDVVDEDNYKMNNNIKFDHNSAIENYCLFIQFSTINIRIKYC